MTTTTTSNLDSPALDISQFDRTPFYCEENVYMLCKKLCTTGMANTKGSDLFIVFISNEKKQVPMWHQKASSRADGIVLWDYHVICIQIKGEGYSSNLVWDLDSSLPFPSPLSSYVSESIRPSYQLFPEYQRFFRIVHAPNFLKDFASDRRHMKDSVGNWTAQPPSYEAIAAEDGTVHNLNEYLDMHATDVVKNVEADTLNNSVLTQKLGVVVNESQLVESLSLLS